jgi:hypothetical protein
MLRPSVVIPRAALPTPKATKEALPVSGAAAMPAILIMPVSIPATLVVIPKFELVYAAEGGVGAKSL